MNCTTLIQLPHLPLGQMSEIELVSSAGPSIVHITPFRPRHRAVLLHTRRGLTLHVHVIYMLPTSLQE